jgi:hypothetical protein
MLTGCAARWRPCRQRRGQLTQTGDPGNSAIRLISVDGGENDAVNGIMRMTAHLKRSPYLRQVLAGFGVVWSRSRLLRLAAGAVVPAHSDIHYHWFYRVRMHVPIVTLPPVRFTCGAESVHMAAGEAWVFDNWRVHHVENPTDADRVHLVADTWGSAAFWELIAQGAKADAPIQHRNYDPAQTSVPLTERSLLRPVMAPAEMDLLILDLPSELVPEGTCQISAPEFRDTTPCCLHWDGTGGSCTCCTARNLRVGRTSRNFGTGYVIIRHPFPAA